MLVGVGLLGGALAMAALKCERAHCVTNDAGHLICELTNCEYTP